VSTDNRSFISVRRIVAVIGAVGIIAGAAYALNTQRRDDHVIARVGDRELTDGQLLDIVQSIPNDGGVAVELVHANRQLTSWVLTQAVAQELVSRGAGSTEIDEAEGLASLSNDPQFGSIDVSSPYGETVVEFRRELVAAQTYADSFVNDDDIVVSEELTEEEAATFVAAEHERLTGTIFQELVDAARARAESGTYIDPRYGHWDADFTSVIGPSGVVG